ncbi:MAG: 50S ribosomal protein L24 [Bacteroidota bacterium]|nr:50S ribosomal protein L24 [Bacteroidota bacterium]
MKNQKFSRKIKIKKEDTVIAISGNYKGKKGRVLSLNREKNKAIVEGINIITKHTKPSQENQDGGIIKKEAYIDISNLMLINPKTSEPTRVGKKRDDEGKLVRYSKKTGEEI